MENIDVYDFLVRNITPYAGEADFLAGPSQNTACLWELAKKALKEERENQGCRAIDAETISTITSHQPGYLDQTREVIVGLQTDEPLKRAIKPFGGVNVVRNALKERGLDLPGRITEIFLYAQSHNDAVFAAYDSEVRAFRSKHILTGQIGRAHV